MASPYTDGEGEIIRAEHIAPLKTGDNIQAKRVATYVWNSGTGEWERMTQPGGSSSSGKATDAYGYQAESNDGTYTYYFFESADTNYYLMREHDTTGQISYAKGTGSYTTVYVDSTSAPSGPPTWGTYGVIF